MSFHSSFGLPLTIARPFNTYGPRQSARAVIPTIISQIASGQESLKLGDLTPTRDLNYVVDTCAALLMLAQCDDAVGEIVNIGSNNEISIEDLAKLILTKMGSELSIVSDKVRLRPQNSEVFRLICDNRKLKELTGYAPFHSLDTGIQETINWFLDPENIKKYKSGIYNI